MDKNYNNNEIENEINDQDIKIKIIDDKNDIEN